MRETARAATRRKATRRDPRGCRQRKSTSFRDAADDPKAARDKRGPAGLMACAESAAIFAVKVFIKQKVVAPVRIGGETRVVAVARTASIFVHLENAREPPR